MTVLPSNVGLANIADGANIVAADHRNNYSALQTWINAVNAILSAGAAGQVLASSGGTTIGWQNATTTYRKTTAKTVNTTVAATDLLNGEITVPAGAMGTTGVLRLTVWGDWLMNPGSSGWAAPRFQLLLGGTTLIDTNVGPATTASARGPWKLSAIIQNATATSQTVELEFQILAAGGFGATTSNFVTGEGIYFVTPTGTGVYASGLGVNSGLAVNTAVAQALVLNVINGVSSATYETKLLGALIEVI